MNAKAWVKSGKVSSRWSLPSFRVQPGRAARRCVTSESASLVGRAMLSLARGGRPHDGGALDVLVAHLADVEALDVLDELLEGLLEAGQRLALARQRGGAGEDEVLHVGMVDAALLDPGDRHPQGLVGLAHQRGALLALLERFREVPLQELVDPAQDRGERAAC